MGFYERLQGTANSLLARFKQGTATLVRKEVTSQSVDPWGADVIADVSYTLKGIAEGVEKKFIDGELILASDVQVTISPIATRVSDGVDVAIEPQMTDTLVLDGKTRIVKKIIKIPELGTPVIYIIFVAG